MEVKSYSIVESVTMAQAKLATEVSVQLVLPVLKFKL
jgi:hypothetical protein